MGTSRGRILSRRSGLAVGLVILLGVLGTGLSAFALHVSARNWTERAFEHKQDVITKVVTAELIQYGTALADLSASMGAQRELTAETFAAITSPINNARLPGATEVEYVVPASPGDVQRVQSEWRRRGSDGLTLRPAPGAGGEHYFPVLGHALVPGAAAVGGGVSQAEVVDALRRARIEGGITTSATYQPAGAAERAFVMVAAVHDAGRFEGWVTMTFDGRDFLGAPPGIIGGNQVSVELADISRGPPVTIATWQPGAKPYSGLPARTVELTLPPKQWVLTIRPTVRLLPATEEWLARGAAVIGGLITVLLATLTATVVTSRDRAVRRVDQATAELRLDIERREAVEQQLLRREEELVGFAGVVAHDLRSPLATVIGFAGLIAAADEGGLSEKQRANLARVQNSAARMQALIDDLLAYATADNTTLRITRIDLDEMVDSILAERLGAASAAAATRVDRGTLPAVQGDPTQVRQVLDNLIGNAIKYTPPERAAEIRISAAPAADVGMSRIEVADRGIGVPEAQRAEVFNAFTRAEGSEKFPGTGLGLAIVQRIVERHGGSVGVEANPGGGTVFWFTLATAAEGFTGINGTRESLVRAEHTH
ncbi:ATP-binding protein [Paractinoplanes rishiriensis]|uniref:Sensor-like histidine kinase SenX3 n=1 Tax=Paractinoplanes rishiriensis TaxID=1050105 RepID=A0A919JWQ8_9ACTN|nr:ATP-binding protein [Actinoplanes rishiriensis]GIE94533.1 hypothetical protein Ari01nite_19980 [Actinoplanes rishiriensis]